MKKIEKLKKAQKMIPLLLVKQKIVVAMVGLNILIAFFAFSIINQGDSLEVVFFNVGQGSSIFIETPQKKQVLIDGGPDGLLILKHLSQEMPFWDRHIDIIISTHSSADHLIGLVEVLDRYKIDKVIWTGMSADSLVHQQFKEKIKLAEQKGTEIIIAQFGQKIKLEPDIYFKILNPLTKIEGTNPVNHNNNSIVVRLAFNKISFLLTSDIEKEREMTLIQKQEILQQNFLSADIMKAPHHGSRTSSSLKFLQAIQPKISIIQAGKDNPFNHPHQEVIDRLNKMKIDIFQTDIHGTIRIISDGEKYEIITD